MSKKSNRSPKDIAALLRADGWVVKRRGPVHPRKPGKVTLDTGANPIPTGTLRSIYRQAGWDW